MNKKTNTLTIRNSTAEFLIFTSQSGNEGIEVRVENENIWLTQKPIAKLFNVKVNTINYHLKEIFKSSELKGFAIKGYVLDSERLKNGVYLNKRYYEDLLLEIRDIRASERNFYQKITDIYSTAIDYDLQSPITEKFFATVQNKCTTLYIRIQRQN